MALLLGILIPLVAVFIYAVVFGLRPPRRRAWRGWSRLLTILMFH